MSDLTFTDEDAPTTVRKTEPNPYLAAVASLTPDSGKAKGFDAPTNNKGLAKVRRLLTDAGDAAKTDENPNGVTVRWEKTPNEDGTTHIRFYAVSKIKRKGAPAGSPIANAVADAVAETPAKPAAKPRAPRAGK